MPKTVFSGFFGQKELGPTFFPPKYLLAKTPGFSRKNAVVILEFKKDPGVLRSHFRFYNFEVCL